METTDGALAIVRAYHRGWTGKNFDEAIRLLSPDLKVETPINNYPTKESFAEAVAPFGGRFLEERITGGSRLSALALKNIDIQGGPK